MIWFITDNNHFAIVACNPVLLLGSVLSLVESSVLNTNIFAISAQSMEDNSANMNF